ncbi:MAG TPA: non-heme iron oxygenase ferredoxin subunit [Steroidobacteraceae bacterium]|mgnify:FL=1|nr:non-heme iron oxygenase ferredoxin subunit [Steroidobacteraceae bacterium]
MAELRFEPALALADLPRGSMRACTIDGRNVLLCHTKDGLHAVDNICTHAYARLDEGWLRGHKLVCPLHGAVFDVRDGKVLKGPATERLPVHHLRVIGDQVEVALDPAAAAQEVEF